MTYLFTLDNDTKGVNVLTSDPKGWQDVVLNIKRDVRFLGLFYDYSVMLEFFCNGGGREYIEDVIDTLGLDEEIRLTVDVDCDNTGTFIELYTGTLNLESLNENQRTLGCNIEQNNFTNKFRNRLDVPIDLDSNTSLEGTALAAMNFGPYDLTLHSRTLTAGSELDDDLLHIESFSIGGAAQPVERLYIQVPYVMIKNELKETSDVVALGQKTAAGTTIDATNVTYFHNTEPQSPLLVPGTYNVAWDFSGTYTDDISSAQNRIVGGIAPVGEDILLLLYHGPDLVTAAPSVVVLGNIPGYTDATTQKQITFNFVGSTTFTMNPGDKMWLVWLINGYDITVGVGPFGVDITFDHSGGGDTANLTFDIDSTFPASTSESWCIFEAFSRVSQNITDETNPFRSDYFGRLNSQPESYGSNGCGSFTAITNGYQIRKLALADYPVQMSFNELYDAMNSVWNLGLGIETDGADDVIRVETKDHFFDNTTVFTASDPSGVTRSVFKDWIFNEIEGGYSKWEVEDINSVDEYNTQRKFANIIKKSKNTIKARSKFIAGGYAIEITRRFGLQGTKDYKYDKDNFIVCLNRSVDGGGIPDTLTVAEQDENAASIANILNDTTVYNLRISPIRNMMRWMYWFAIGLEKLTGEAANVQFIEGNSQAEFKLTDNNCPGDFNNVLLTETSNIAWDSANLESGTVQVKPFIYEFRFPLSFTDFIAIRDNPTQTIVFDDWDGVSKKGFIMELNYEPNKGQADFVLIESNL